MSLEISESEMIERFADGLKKSASKAKEFITAEEKDKPNLFVEFIQGLKVAAGSAHQLALYQENPNFLDIRDKIEKVIEVGQNPVTFTSKQAGLWFSIKNSLEALSMTGIKMAQSKAMKRVDVLSNLTFRESQARLKNE